MAVVCLSRGGTLFSTIPLVVQSIFSLVTAWKGIYFLLREDARTRERQGDRRGQQMSNNSALSHPPLYSKYHRIYKGVNTLTCIFFEFWSTAIRRLDDFPPRAFEWSHWKCKRCSNKLKQHANTNFRASASAECAAGICYYHSSADTITNSF